MTNFSVTVLSLDRLSSVISTRVPDFSPSAVAMAAAEGVLGAPPGALGTLAVFGVDSTAAAGSFLDEAELFSPGLMQPQKVITKPSNISMQVFEEVNLSRI